MKRRAKRRRSGSIRKEPRAPTMPAGRQSSDFPPPFDMIAMELWHPGKRETLRRQLIDGNAGEIELLLLKLAYSSSLEPDQAEQPNEMRFMTWEQFLRGEAFKPGPPYLNAPPGLE